MTQLDGEGMRQMESFEANLMKQQQQRHVVQNMAAASGQSIAELGAAQPQQPHGIPVSQIFHQPQQQADDVSEQSYEDAAESTGEIGGMPPAVQAAHVVVPAAPPIAVPVPAVAMLHAPPAAVQQPVMAGFQADLAAEMAAQAKIQFEEERKAMQAQIFELQQHGAGKATEITDLTARIAALSASGEGKANEITDLTARIAALSASSEGKVNEFTASTLSKDNELRDLKAQLTSKANEMKALNSAKEKEIRDLAITKEKEYTELKARFSALETSQTQLAGSSAEMHKQLEVQRLHLNAKNAMLDERLLNADDGAMKFKQDFDREVGLLKEFQKRLVDEKANFEKEKAEHMKSVASSMSHQPMAIMPSQHMAMMPSQPSIELVPQFSGAPKPQPLH